jgi:hypothetical protein
MSTQTPYQLLTVAQVMAAERPPYCFLLEQFREVDHLLCDRKKFGTRLSSAEYSLLYTHVPYVLHSVAGLDDVLCVVSRRYKPIGTLISRPSRRDDAPYGVGAEPWHIPKVLAQKALGSAYEAHEHLGDVALFDDGCLPWASRSNRTMYLDKLRSLMHALEGRVE